MNVRVVGDPAALALAGCEGPEGSAALIVALDDVPMPADDPGVVRWWRGAPGAAAASWERQIATQGDGLWSRAPWPVRDALFALAPAAAGRVLVVEPDPGRRGVALDEIRSRGLPATGTDRLTLEDLVAADVVLHGVGPPAALPGDALSVLAAGRLLIVNARPAFGLQAGIDYLAAEGVAPAADLCEAVVSAPRAFEAMRRFARGAARCHRASLVYPRLAAEVGSEG